MVRTDYYEAFRKPGLEYAKAFQRYMWNAHNFRIPCSICGRFPEPGEGPFMPVDKPEKICVLCWEKEQENEN